MTEAQDPNERFDIVTFNGELTGMQKRRGDVHRDGEWHRSVHIWIVGQRDGHGFLLLQRRSLAKDTRPGALDPAVSGHLGAGETWEDGFRETREEIGLEIRADEAVLAGIRRAVNEEADVRDHEIQHVYFVRNDAPLSTYRPNRAEIDALVELDINRALDLLSGDRDLVTVDVLDATTLAVGQQTFARPEFGVQLDRYVYRVAIAARQFLMGERHFSV